MKSNNNPEVISEAKKQIGNFFKSRRQSLGFTVREVAALAGTSDYGLISRFEAGKANPTLEMFFSLLIAYRINPHFIEKENSEIVRPAFGLDNLPEN